MQTTRHRDGGESGTPAEDLEPLPSQTSAAPVVLTFDIEEHHRIEAAAGLPVGQEIKWTYHDRMCRATEWILGELDVLQIRATFFFLGEIAKSNPRLVRTVRQAGHEVASHGWDHRRLHVMSPDAFQEDARKSKEAIEQAAGGAVVGFRAPTFSVVRQTAWALDVLAELGFLYDSSIYPVYHDRYRFREILEGRSWHKVTGIRCWRFRRPHYASAA